MLDRECAMQGTKLPSENLDASEFEMKLVARTYDVHEEATTFYYDLIVRETANSGKDASALSKIVLGIEKCSEALVSYNYSNFKPAVPLVDTDTCIEGVVVPASLKPGETVGVQVKLKGEVVQGLVNYALVSEDGGFYGFAAIEGPNCVCDPTPAEGQFV